MPDDIRQKRRRKQAERRRKPAERRSKCRIQSGGMNIQTCRHTMTEKWTKRKTERKMRSQNSRTQNNGKGRNNEIRDIERRRRASGGGAHRTRRGKSDSNPLAELAGTGQCGARIGKSRMASGGTTKKEKPDSIRRNTKKERAG